MDSYVSSLFATFCVEARKWALKFYGYRACPKKGHTRVIVLVTNFRFFTIINSY